LQSHRHLADRRLTPDQLTSERLEDGRPVIASMPSLVKFNIITKCHAKCIMCGYTNVGQILSLARFKRTADELLSTAEQVLLIGGEVMLHPNFYEICNYVRRFGVRTRICTNLYTLTGRRAEAIERFLDAVSVSIDGATKRTYESIRTNLSFDGLTDNLHALAAIKSRNPQLDLYWRFVAMRRNIQELPAAIEMAHQFGFCKMNVNFVVVRHPLPLDESLLFHRDLANRCFDQARKRADELDIEVKIPQNFDLNQQPYMNSGVPTKAFASCKKPWEHIRIALNGNVTPCCDLQKVPMGNIFNENFDRIWNGRKFKRLRESLKTGSHEIPERCRSCRLLTKHQSDSNNAVLHVALGRCSEMEQKLQSQSGT
jgi:radical SAM protein with 4Fe4S-binding SPASM domain